MPLESEKRDAKRKRYYFDAPQQTKYLCLCLTHQNGHLSRLKSSGASSLVFLGSVSIGKKGNVSTFTFCTEHSHLSLAANGKASRYNSLSQ